MTDQRAQISLGDEVYFTEMLRDAKGGAVDLLIETPGGYTDPTEKIASLLRTLAPDLRVIVPYRAKSNGTMIALVGSDIIMGPASELGPADPFISLGPNNKCPLISLSVSIREKLSCDCKGAQGYWRSLAESNRPLDITAPIGAACGRSANNRGFRP